MTKQSVIYPHIEPRYSGLRVVLEMRKNLLGYFTNLGLKKDGYAWLSIGKNKILFLNDATAIEHVLSGNHKNYCKSKASTENLEPLLGEGIVLSEGDLWNKQRRDTAPVFAAGNFPDFIQRIVEATEAMLKRWEPLVEKGEPIDVLEESMKVTFDVLLRALFHEPHSGALGGVEEAMGTLLRLAEERIWSAVNLPMGFVLKLPKYTRTRHFLNRLVDELIEHRRQNKAYPEDLLSRLILSHGTTERERKLLHDNIRTFLLAGHETTANNLAWAFYELGRHTEIRERIIAEVDSVLGGKVIDYDLAKSLKYTEKTVSESLRMHPPVWTISRGAIEDDIVPLDDGRHLFMPKGSIAMCCAYSAHRNERYWSDPESFTPERFSAEETKKRPKFAWFPFGGGPRLCLGFRFSEFESRVILAMVYQKYNLKLIPGQEIQPEPMITLRPDRPVLFRVTARNVSTKDASSISGAGQGEDGEHATPTRCRYDTGILQG